MLNQDLVLEILDLKVLTIGKVLTSTLKKIIK